MQEALTRQQKADLLITRAVRLKVFAEQLGENGRRLVESEAYLVLEVFESRPRAVWRHLSWAIRQWRNKWRFNLEFAPRLWWYRHVRGIDHGTAIDQAYKRVEEKLFPSAKGGA